MCTYSNKTVECYRRTVEKQVLDNENGSENRAPKVCNSKRTRIAICMHNMNMKSLGESIPSQESEEVFSLFWLTNVFFF